MTRGGVRKGSLIYHRDARVPQLWHSITPKFDASPAAAVVAGAFVPSGVPVCVNALALPSLCSRGEAVREAPLSAREVDASGAPPLPAPALLVASDSTRFLPFLCALPPGPVRYMTRLLNAGQP